MSPRILVDTGPLVAFLNRRDRYHAWATTQLEQLAAPLFTCEAVLSETCFLLRRIHRGSGAALDLVTRGLLRIDFQLAEQVEAVARLMTRYANVPMSLADACLVRMAEERADSRVLTLDRDFRVYRKHGRHVIPAVTPS